MRSAASPDHDHHLSDCLIVYALVPCPTRNVVVLVNLAEQLDTVFAMVSGDRDELVEDQALVIVLEELR